MRIAIIAALLAGAFAAAGCDKEDGGPTGPSGPLGLEGTWRATRAEFTSVAPPVRKVDVVPQGSVVTLVLSAGGAYTFTIAEPGLTPVVSSGSWTTTNDVLTLRPTGMSFSIEFDRTLSGNDLTLAGGSVEFEFTDGVVEEAKLTMALIRQ